MYFAWGGQARPLWEGGTEAKTTWREREDRETEHSGQDKECTGRDHGRSLLSSQTESPVRLVHMRGCQRPFSRSSLVMVPPFPASLAAEDLGLSSQQ